MTSHIVETRRKLEAATGFEPVIRALQARALPLGYAAATPERLGGRRGWLVWVTRPPARVKPRRFRSEIRQEVAGSGDLKRWAVAITLHCVEELCLGGSHETREQACRTEVPLHSTKQRTVARRELQ
jgi:hypothetical protein